MSNLLSAIGDFISVLIMGGVLLLGVGELKLATAKKAKAGTSKMSKLTQIMSGEKLDLSEKRVYGR